MNIPGILIAIVVFGVIIAIHEFGHFLLAKKADIKVNKFAIGMGPKLFKFQKGETEYSLRLFPIGGFCAMEGEDESSEDARAFGKKSVPRRISVVVAGAIMNLILGFVILIIITATSDKLLSCTVGGFRDNATSSSSGLEVGDKIVEIDGLNVLTDSDIVYKLNNNTSETYDVTVKRDGKKILLEDVKFYYHYYYYVDEGTQEYVKFANEADYTGDMELKKAENSIDFWVEEQNKNVFTVVGQAFKETVSTGRLIWITLFDLITGKYGIKDMSGPIGIVTAIGEASTYGLSSVLTLMTFITINVGIFNLLPLPALDGGRLVFLIIEGIRKKPVPPEKEGMVHFIGLAALMLLMLVVTFNDIVRIFQK